MATFPVRLVVAILQQRLLTYQPYIAYAGHVHNFYIQNIRNNKNNRRTPKWAQRYGLVDTTTIERHKARSQWAARYNERNPHSTLEDQAYEAGQSSASLAPPTPTSAAALRPQHTAGGTALWDPNDEQYYNANGSDNGSAVSSSRWHYPANFDDAMPAEPPRKKKIKKDRHARTEDAYANPQEGSGRRRKKKRSSSGRHEDYAASRASSIGDEGPENSEGAYGGGGGRGAQHSVCGGRRRYLPAPILNGQRARP